MQTPRWQVFKWTLRPEKLAFQIPSGCSRDPSPRSSWEHVRFAATTGEEPSSSPSSQGTFEGTCYLYLQNACICSSSSSHVHAHLGSLTRYMVIPISQISGGSKRTWFPGGPQWGQGTQPQDPAFSPLPKVTLSIALDDFGDRTPNKDHLTLRLHILIVYSCENLH